MVDRQLLRIAAVLLFAGVLLSLVAGSVHADHAPANNHSAAFTEYAGSGHWVGVHLGQFIGMAVFVTGLLSLGDALQRAGGIAEWAARVGAVSGLVALALYGVLQAIDGVALKHAVEAWAAAPEAERAARFASAEAVRWLEWGVRSYHSLMLGLSLILIAAALTTFAWPLRAIGALMALSGLVSITQAWVVGVEGFSAANTAAQRLGVILIVGWSVLSLLVAVWGGRVPAAALGDSSREP